LGDTVTMGGTECVERIEWALYALLDRSTRLAFGDFGICDPGPAAKGIAQIPNMRYADDTMWLVTRGVSTRDEALAAQMPALARASSTPRPSVFPNGAVMTGLGENRNRCRSWWPDASRPTSAPGFLTQRAERRSTCCRGP